jgi:DNA (cytosine-5)-methyltransferase 1
MTGTQLRYLSVCSGIEAATVAWHPLGWEPVAFSEIEPFPCAVLNHHYPHVPNLGDMTKFQEWPDANVNVLVGGTPCQSFSVAGLRKGLADPRGNLMLTFGAIASRYRPTWLVWENVFGVLSSNGGRDFGTFLGMLAELGYGFAYRVLDAQYFGVAQRRRRVFVVGHLGDWRRAAAVLFERESLSGNPAPSRKAREGVAGTLKGGTGTRGYPDPSDGNGGGLIAVMHETGQGFWVPGEVSGTLRAEGENRPSRPSNVVCMATGQASAEIGIGIGTTLNCNHEAPIVTTQYGSVAGSLTARHDSSPCADRGQNIAAVSDGLAVRRLTPVECERLQGFPDTYTLVPYNTKPAADSPRYKALGNSMAVPVMQWIGQRIQQVEDL